MPDDGAGRPGYYTAEQLAAVIFWLSDYCPVNPPDEILDAIAWAAELILEDEPDVNYDPVKDANE